MEQMLSRNARGQLLPCYYFDYTCMTSPFIWPMQDGGIAMQGIAVAAISSAI
jgi:hypothetical protein